MDNPPGHWLRRRAHLAQETERDVGAGREPAARFPVGLCTPDFEQQHAASLPILHTNPSYRKRFFSGDKSELAFSAETASGGLRVTRRALVCFSSELRWLGSQTESDGGDAEAARRRRSQDSRLSRDWRHPTTTNMFSFPGDIIPAAKKAARLVMTLLLRGARCPAHQRIQRRRLPRNTMFCGKC